MPSSVLGYCHAMDWTIVVAGILVVAFIGLGLTWAAVRGTRVVWFCVIAVTLAQFAVTYLAPLQATAANRATKPLATAAAVAGAANRSGASALR